MAGIVRTRRLKLRCLVLVQEFAGCMKEKSHASIRKPQNDRPRQNHVATIVENVERENGSQN